MSVPPAAWLFKAVATGITVGPSRALANVRPRLGGSYEMLSCWRVPVVTVRASQGDAFN